MRNLRILDRSGASLTIAGLTIMIIPGPGWPASGPGYRFELTTEQAVDLSAALTGPLLTAYAPAPEWRIVDEWVLNGQTHRVELSGPGEQHPSAVAEAALLYMESASRDVLDVLCERLGAEPDELLGKIATLQRTAEELATGAAVQHAQGQIDLLGSDVMSLQRTNAEYVRQLTNARATIDTIKADRETIKGSLERVKEDRRGILATLEDARADLQQLGEGRDNALAERNAQIEVNTELLQLVDRMRVDHDAAVALRTEANAITARFQGQLQSADDQLAHTATELKEAKYLIKQLGSALDQANAKRKEVYNHGAVVLSKLHTARAALLEVRGEFIDPDEDRAVASDFSSENAALIVARLDKAIRDSVL